MRHEDLLQFYARHFRPGALDLSSSCPAPMPIQMPGGVLAGEQLAFVPPGGAPELRAAIASRYGCVSADDVVLASGASEALAALVFATVGRGDVVWARPGAYPSFVEAVGKVDARLTCGPMTPGTRLALGSNPAVPRGGLVNLEEFASRCEKAGAIPAMDEVYRDLHCGGPLPALADISRHGVSIGDLSKPLGLGALRIGWLATRERTLCERLDRELQLLSGGPSSLSVAAALAAFAHFDEAVGATMRAASGNESSVRMVLERHGWRVSRAEAGVTLLATPPRPVRAAALRRIEDAGFFFLPGQTIGAPGAFRVTLLVEPELLDRALALLETAPEE